MKVYDAAHIRNVALVGHQGSGKTMLSEAMLFTAGAINRMGTIEEGSTQSDYHRSERERQMSVFTSVLHAEWKGHKINILDTPGYLDFTGEVVSALKVVDTAIFVLDAVEGVQVGTEVAWSNAEKAHTPIMFVLNHLDKDDANFEERITEIQERFGRGATVVQLPGGAGTRSVIDVLLMKQITFPEGKKEPEFSEIPEAFKSRAEELHNKLIEDIAENDEDLMDLYFEEGTLTEDQMRKGLHEAMLQRNLFPIFLTSAKHNIGVARLMSFIDNVCPSPSEMPPAATQAGAPVAPTADGSPVAFVFRTMAEEHVGEYSFFRIYSGALESGLDLENAQTQSGERLGQLYSLNGKTRDSVQKMEAGDIGAVVKLKNTHTNDTLRLKGSDVEIKPIEFPNPRYHVAVRALKTGEEDKMAQGLHRIHAEDPSLHVVHDPDLKQMVLGGQGNMHMEIAKYRLKNQAGVEIEFIKPKIGYRETVTKSARSSYRHKKQTGGAGQFADISMIVEPFDGTEYQPPSDIKVRDVVDITTNWGSRIQYIDAIVGGVIDMRRFFGAIQKGVAEKLQEGPMAGYPVGDVRIIIYDGGMHSVDSNEAAFKSAARMCFVDGFRKASPVLLEPINEVQVTMPESYMGDVLGDLNTRRARVQGMEAEGTFQKIVASVPQAELYQYSTTLRSLTQGRGIHQEGFTGYEIMPRNVQESVIAEAKVEDE